jgi:hypothetical protein
VDFKTRKVGIPTVTTFSPATGTTGKGRTIIGAGADRTVTATQLSQKGFSILYNDVADTDEGFSIQWTAEAEL